MNDHSCDTFLTCNVSEPSVGFAEGIANRSRFLACLGAEKVEPPVQDFSPVDDAVRLILDRYKPEMVVVHGPSARGYTEDGTALSILIVKDTTHVFRSQQTITRALARSSLFGDFDVITPEHYRRTVLIPGTMAYKATEDGYIAYRSRGRMAPPTPSYPVMHHDHVGRAVPTRKVC